MDKAKMARLLLWLALLCAALTLATSAGLGLPLTHVDGGQGDQYIAEYLIGHPPQKRPRRSSAPAATSSLDAVLDLL